MMPTAVCQKQKEQVKTGWGEKKKKNHYQQIVQTTIWADRRNKNTFDYDKS